MLNQQKPSTLVHFLTRREFQVVMLVSEGPKNGEIGKCLGTIENVIENCLREIFDKARCWNRVEPAFAPGPRRFYGLFQPVQAELQQIPPEFAASAHCGT